MSVQPIINPVNFLPLAARVPKVNSQLTWADKLGALNVRLAINRSSYTVNAGIYAIGKPDRTSDVIVTANYKLTFDIVRKNLDGLNAWILVLDAKGINVWCAAGKGTFGTAELIKRIKETSLADIVSHKKLILPQLGAVGVAAHKVKELTGFTVVYGPVRIEDIHAFIANDYKSTPNMRRVEFPWKERLKLVPVEIVLSFKYFLIAMFLLQVLSGIQATTFSFEEIKQNLAVVFFNLLVGYLSGTILMPLLLSVLPFRNFSAKGFVVGLITSSILFFCNFLGDNLVEISSWYLMLGAVSSFLAMNFTGTSTYTSLSGVKKEMKIALPLQIAAVSLGLILFVLSKIFF